MRSMTTTRRTRKRASMRIRKKEGMITRKAKGKWERLTLDMSGIQLKKAQVMKMTRLQS
jgi:hypothetical protein